VGASVQVGTGFLALAARREKVGHRFTVANFILSNERSMSKLTNAPMMSQENHDAALAFE
jgi:hypothetical protein